MSSNSPTNVCFNVCSKDSWQAFKEWARGRGSSASAELNRYTAFSGLVRRSSTLKLLICRAFWEIKVCRPRDKRCILLAIGEETSPIDELHKTFIEVEVARKIAKFKADQLLDFIEVTKDHMNSFL